MWEREEAGCGIGKRQGVGKGGSMMWDREDGGCGIRRRQDGG